MPPRRRAGADHLSDEQLAELTVALAEDRRATVYLIEGIPSLGIEPGVSAKVIGIDGRTVTVRPKGVNDELPFESDELRMTRPTAATKTRAAEPAAAPRPAVKPAPAPAPAAAPAPKPTAQKPAAQKPAAQKPAAQTTPAPKPAASAPATKETPVSAPTSQSSDQGTKPKAPARRPKKQPGVSITITIDPDNEWTVAVAHGARRVGKPTPVGPDAVERAVRELGDEAALEAVQSVIDEARQAAEERVAQLSAQLEAAKKALESLGATAGQIG